MDNQYIKRLFQIISPLKNVVLLGIGYYAFIKITHVSIPCLIKLVTGKFCPGCGVTRMFLALFEGDWQAAYHANRLLFCLIPILLLYGLVKAGYYIGKGKNFECKLEQIGVIVIFVITVIFWILRNTESYSYLAPQ